MDKFNCTKLVLLWTFCAVQFTSGVYGESTSETASDLLYKAARNCGYSPKVNLPISQTQNAINTAVAGQFPWSVAILSSKDVFLCAGTLISESIVVTTASCILNYQKTNQPLKAVVGAYNIPGQLTDAMPSFEVYVRTAVVHPLHKADAAPPSLEHNIGLLRLAKNVDFDLYPWIFPVCIIGPELEKKQGGANNCRVIGWPELHNKNQPAGVKAAVLQVANVTVSNTGCTAPSTSCINGPACNSNEGSEVICLAPASNRYYQWGIVGTEPQCPGMTPSTSVPTISVIDNYDFVAKYLRASNPNPN